jgi:hypothetical protein
MGEGGRGRGRSVLEGRRWVEGGEEREVEEE